MKKLLSLIAVLVTASLSSFAQDAEEATATQTAALEMSNAIDIGFTSTGSEEGDMVILAFEDVNDYANGVESDKVQLRIRSNKKFHVWAKAGSNRFTYSGNSDDPKMNVNKLKIKVVNNNTGGKVASSVNNKYANMSKSNKKLINNGTPGGDNTFAVQYKADPGYEFPAGTYSVNIVYTTTQL